MKSRMTLRRPCSIVERQANRMSGAEPVRFMDVPIHGYFTIRPPEFVNIRFIKVNRTGAQIENWNNDSSFPDQSFPHDMRVYMVPTRR